MLAAQLSDFATLPEAFAAVVRAHPGRPALRDGMVTLTYRDLDERSDRLAGAIRARAADPARPVAILLQRGADVVVAAVAVLKAGCSYLPLDPETPPARFAAIIEDARPSVFVTTPALASQLPDGAVAIAPDEQAPRPEAAPATVNERAYVIFTSGTSGRPKGVQVSHHNVLRLFGTSATLFDFTCEDVWTLFHSFAFDFSVWEMWGALLHGGCLVIVPAETVRNPAGFRALLLAEGVTVLNQTPTAFNPLIAEEARHEDRLPLRYVVFAGEALRFADLRSWFAKYGDGRPELVNMYGITETTVHSSYRRVRAADVGRATSMIGVPLPDLEFLLVDEELTEVAPGKLGEIVVTGPGVTMGYLNRKDLTRARYFDVRGRDGALRRAYRSGDLARLDDTGDLEYHGRLDDQVKIRGFRIELGEIHAALATAPGVVHIAVRVHTPRAVAEVVVKDYVVSDEIADVRDLLRGRNDVASGESETAKIIAYVVVEPEFQPNELFRAIRESLPAYMRPAAIIPVPEIPVNRNGKVDFAALPDPGEATPLRLPNRSGTSEPGGMTAAESQICALFENVLGLDEVDPGESFFAIGGDSILALKLCALAEQRGIVLELPDVYSLHSPRELAAVSRRHERPAETTVRPFSLISAGDHALITDGRIEDAYPLSALQAGVLFHNAYGSAMNMYCDVFMFRFRTGYDHSAMERAVQRAVERHDILRTSFHFTGYSEPLQLVHDTAVAPITVVDLTALDPAGQQRRLDEWLRHEKATPYDWSVPPLLRFCVHHLAQDEFVLWMSFHDALLDGWSESALLTEVLLDYSDLRRGRDLPARPRPDSRYADFVSAELRSRADEKVRAFWEAELDDVEPMTLPVLGDGDQDVHRGRIGFLSVEIGPEISQRLDDVARAHDVTLKHVLLAVQTKVLATVTGRDEVVLAVESNGRVERGNGIEVLGTHLNVVPYRLATEGRTWAELAKAAWRKENELLPVRRYPLADLQRLAGTRELTDVLFNYTHFHGYAELGSTDVQVVDAKGYNQTNLALRVEFNKDPFSRILNLDLEANLERIPPEQLRSLAILYRNAFEAVAADSEQVPAVADLLGQDWIRALLEASRGPALPDLGPDFFTVFAETAAQYENRVAAACGGESLTYGELAVRVGRLASRLVRSGAGAGVPIGVLAERDLDYLVTVLAILRVGAVYLPLPPGPPARIARVLALSGARLVLRSDVQAEVVDGAGVPVLDFGRAHADAAAEPVFDGAAPKGADPAYLIFTSGSTGEPKGALIRHDGMLNHLAAKIEAIGLGPDDAVSQDAAATFDISIWQWLAPLLVGATTIIYSDRVGQDPARLLHALAEDGATILEVTPSVLVVLTAELERYGTDAFPGLRLRVVLSQAETLTPQQANAWLRLLPGTRLFNMWGATEVSDDCAHYEVTFPADERSPSVPVGRPVRNTTLYVLDETREPVPDGTPGELYVGGICVGAGYLDDHERTARAFVPDPHAVGPHKVMYRTGDRVRRLGDGALEFLGRRDGQVKIRGRRVELGEVSAALSGLSVVRECAVVVHPGAEGADTRLAGFYVPRTEVSVGEVRTAIGQVLPRHAVPDVLVPLAELPRTTHGKVDSRALADWDLGQLSGATAGATLATPTEVAVAEVWRTVLKADQLGANANFFEIGGHSLHATQVVARLRDRFAGIDLPVRVLFEHPVVRELAARLDELLAEYAQAPAAELLIPARRPGTTEFPLAHNQSSLWFLDQLDPDDRSYEHGNLIHLEGPLDVAALEFAVDTVADRHEILSMRIPSRDGEPYQTCADEARLRLEIVDVDSADLPDSGKRFTSRGFDLAAGPLSRAILYRLAPDRHVFEWSCHHAVADGWSNNLFVQEIQEAYTAYHEGRKPALPKLVVQYADYALWQRKFLGSAEATMPELRFWRSYLADYPGELDLVTDVERTADRSRAAGYCTRTWDETSSSRIAEFARNRQTTPFVLLHAATAALMAKLAQQDDIVLGAAVAGRTIAGTERLLGFFANMLPFRYVIDPEVTGDELVRGVTSSALAAQDHQLIPFQQIVKELGVPRSPGVPPLVQVFVTVDDYPFDLSGLSGLTSHREQLRPVNSLFDLVFEFTTGAELALTLQYDSSLWREQTARRLAEAVARVLELVVSDPGAPIDRADLVSEADRKALAALWLEVSGSPTGHDAGSLAALAGSPLWPRFVDLTDARGLQVVLALAL